MKTTDQVAGEAREKLADPNAVHINMLRGAIAKPSIEQIIHLYGADALLAALRAQPERGGAEEMREQADRPPCAQCLGHGFVVSSGARRYCQYCHGTGVSRSTIRALPLHPAKDDGGGR